MSGKPAVSSSFIKAKQEKPTKAEEISFRQNPQHPLPLENTNQIQSGGFQYSKVGTLSKKSFKPIKARAEKSPSRKETQQRIEPPPKSPKKSQQWFSLAQMEQSPDKQFIKQEVQKFKRQSVQLRAQLLAEKEKSEAQKKQGHLKLQSEINDHRQRQAQMATDYQNLQTEMNQRNQQFKIQMNRKNQELQFEIKSRKQKQVQITELQTQLRWKTETLQSEIQDRKTRQDQMATKYQELQTEMNQKNQELQFEIKSRKQKQVQITELQTQLRWKTETLQSEIQDRKTRQNQMVTEYENFQTEMNQKNQEFQTEMNRKNQELQAEIKSRKQKQVQILEKQRRQNQISDELKKNQAKFAQASQKMRKQLQQVRKLLQEVNAKNNQLLVSSNLKAHQIQQHQILIKQRNNRIDQLVKENKHLKQLDTQFKKISSMTEGTTKSNCMQKRRQSKCHGRIRQEEQRKQVKSPVKPVKKEHSEKQPRTYSIIEN